MTKLYSDLGKTAKKLLNDDYVFAPKLKVASTTEDGRTFTITGEHSSKSDEINADVAIKQKILGQTFTAKLFTGGSATSELKLDDLNVKGLTITLLGGIGKSLGVGTLEYCNGRVGATTAFDYYAGPDVKASTAVSFSAAQMAGFGVVGGEAVYDTSTKEVKGADAAVSYFDGKESEVTLHVQDKAKIGMLSYSHGVRPGFAVGAQMRYDREAKTAALAMGGAYRLDAATTVKSRLDSNGTLALSYIQTIRPKATLTLSTKFDVNSLEGAKMGLSLAIE